MIDISKLSGRYHIRPMEAADAEEILALCRENTLYYQYCGMEPTLEQVLSDLRVAPPGIGPEDKHYVGFYEGAHMTWPSFCLSGMWPSQATITQRGMTVSPGQDILITTRVFFLSPFTDSVSRV